MKIYTKTGDTGKSSLIGGTRVNKNHWRLEAYGTFDELNSFVGKVLSELDSTRLGLKIPVNTENQLRKIQDDLFNIGSHLACDNTTSKEKLPKLEDESITALENTIDDMNLSLEDLNCFVLPGGHVAACSLHLCRTVSRRAERRLIDGIDEDDFSPFILKYINRLSDFFFVAARFVNFHAGQKETPWNQK